MSKVTRFVVWVGAWVAAVTGAHLAINVDWSSLLNDRLPVERRKLNVAYIPVT